MHGMGKVMTVYAAYWVNVAILFLIALALGLSVTRRLWWAAVAPVVVGGIVFLFPVSSSSLPTVVPLVYPCPVETSRYSTLLDVHTPSFGSAGRLGPALAAVVIAGVAGVVTWLLANRRRVATTVRPPAPGPEPHRPG